MEKKRLKRQRKKQRKKERKAAEAAALEKLLAGGNDQATNGDVKAEDSKENDNAAPAPKKEHKHIDKENLEKLYMEKMKKKSKKKESGKHLHSQNLPRV